MGLSKYPDERCTRQARMPGSVGFFFLALPVLVPWELLLGFFFANFGVNDPKLLTENPYEIK